MIETAPADYRFNSHRIKVFGNRKNTSSSHLNEGDSSLYRILGDWILIVCSYDYCKKYKRKYW
jgi:hypothetical protein